jgi:hypothetical protein
MWRCVCLSTSKLPNVKMSKSKLLASKRRHHLLPYPDIICNATFKHRWRKKCFGSQFRTRFVPRWEVSYPGYVPSFAPCIHSSGCRFSYPSKKLLIWVQTLYSVYVTEKTNSDARCIWVRCSL